MPLVNNKVGVDGTDGAVADGRALVDSLMKVVACYRQLASCVGGCTDGLRLWEELRQTREKAQELAAATCRHLTSHLRDKSLPGEERKEMELLWVAFSCSLELLHVDMCKVFNLGDVFSEADAHKLVRTGLQGGGSEVAARALSLPDLNQAQVPDPPAGLDREERSAMEQEIGHISQMMDHMETKVNVLRWTVEPRGPQYAEPLGSSDSASLALMSVDEEQPGRQPLCQHSHIMVLFMLFAVVLLAATLSVSVIFFS